MTLPIDPTSLSKVTSHDPRRVWRNEALDFTPWLNEHIVELNRAIGVEIELSGREVRVGPFAADLVGTEVQTGHAAVIENQLEATDHSHLGQLLTYASGLKAGVVVWLARRFRDEHVEALSWLNEITPEDVNFCGVEMEILEINGNFAPNFKLVVQPNSWQKAKSVATSVGSGVTSERNLRYQAFFAGLLEELKVQSPGITTASKTQPMSWFWFASGKRYLNFSLAFVSGRRFRVELSIDTPDRERNVALCEALREVAPQVEQAVQQPVVWDVSETRRQVRMEVYAPFEVSIDSQEEALARLKAWAVPAMVKFVDILRPRIRALV